MGLPSKMSTSSALRLLSTMPHDKCVRFGVAACTGGTASSAISAYDDGIQTGVAPSSTVLTYLQTGYAISPQDFLSELAAVRALRGGYAYRPAAATA